MSEANVIAPSARTGKIARLPQPIRTALNRRLAENEPGPQLVEWLNGLPEVQKILASDFEGHGVSEQNLSAWRQGGFLDWQAHEELCSRLDALSEREAQAAAHGRPQPDLAGQVHTLALLALERLFEQLATDPCGEDRGERLLRAVQQFTNLQRAQAARERLRCEQERSQQTKAAEAKAVGAPPAPARPIKPNQAWSRAAEPSAEEARGAAGIHPGRQILFGPIQVNQGASSQIKPAPRHMCARGAGNR